MSHGAVASIELDDELIDAVLSDWRTAPVSDRIRATLAFVHKMTLTPDELGPEDARAVLDAGVSREGLEDIIYCCGLINTLGRLADALDFAIPEDEFRRPAPILYRFGYKR